MGVFAKKGMGLFLSIQEMNTKRSLESLLEKNS